MRRADGLTATVAAAIVLGLVVYVRRVVDPREPITWSYQAMALCLVIAAVAGRALVGPRTASEAGRFRWPRAAALPIVFLAAAAPYVHTLAVGFLSDDYGLAYAAEQAGGPLDALGSGAFVTFYRPLTMLVWWLGAKLWSGAPLGYHVLSIMLHGANAILVYAVARRLIGSSYGALFAGLLFAVHPIHVEPVTWVCCSSDLLCTGFALASLALLEAHLARGSQGRHVGTLAAALLAFLLALLSKEAALALPGFVVLRAALLPSGDVRRRVLRLGGAYAMVLAGYLAWRLAVFGGLGGYRLPLTWWNTAFPSAPLLMIGDFLFPVHRSLFAEQLGPSLWWVGLAAMGAGALWWVRGLEGVPARRLWLWLGYVFIMATPTWLFLSAASGFLEWSRLSYLPTVGLAWLFGDVCAGRGAGWRRSGAVAAMIVAGAAALTVWYVTPWREAGELSSQVVAEGRSLIEQLPASKGDPVLFVKDLPESHRGAPVFSNCFPQALNLDRGRALPIRLVSERPDVEKVHPEVIDHWVLQEGEYLAAWEEKSSQMTVVRAGCLPPARSGSTSE